MSYDYTELAAEARRLAGLGVPPPGRAGSPSASSEAEGEQPVLVRELARVVLHLLRERDEARRWAAAWKGSARNFRRWVKMVEISNQNWFRRELSALAELKHLRAGVEAYRADHHAVVDRCGCDVCDWEDEDDKHKQ